MDPSNMRIARLDLSTRAIDLTTALLKATTSSGSLLKGAWEIGQWLGRERLNQYELLDCMQKSKGLAFANKKGQQFFDQIIGGMETTPVGPLFLQESGSLGRLMAGDPDLSWIVSTVACLFQHHRNDMLVTEILLAFIMKSQPSIDGRDIHFAERATPEQTRLRAVVRKIVSSVWFNVVNVGCDTIPLPDELLSICSKGHYLDPVDFSIVVNTIYAHCPSKAILRTDHLLRDVLLWLLMHYDGTIVVNVGGHIVYRADLGNPRRELEVHVSSTCADGIKCGGHGSEHYKILQNISGTFEDFLSGFSFSEFSDFPTRPGIRQKLYEVPRLYSPDSLMWNKSLQVLVKCSAQSIMKWLLRVQLFPQTGFQGLGFTANPNQQATPGSLTVSLVFKRVPSMINLRWGTLLTSQERTIALCPEPVDSHNILACTPLDIESGLVALLTYIPLLEDVDVTMQADCLCLECSNTKNSLDPHNITNKVDAETNVRDNGRYSRTRSLRPGCLRRIAIEEVLLLLAHGLAEGFGVMDASSVSETAPIIEGMVVLLLELFERKQVCWDTWFSVVSCVYLGCPFRRPVSPIHPAFGGTSIAAIQYGNLATQAPWLDLNQSHALRGCFGLIGSRGRIGVMTGSEDQQHIQFRSVEENFAIIETETTEEASYLNSRHPKEPASVHDLQLDDDASFIETDVILCQVDNEYYRILFRIKTTNHWRIVDPSDTMCAIIRMFPSVTCQHTQQQLPIPSEVVKLYTMDEVLGRWPDLVRKNVSKSQDAPPSSGSIHVTQNLDTQLKKNVALALSVCPVTVKSYPEDVCLTCTLAHARKAEREPLRQGESGDTANRYVINLKSNLKEHEYYKLLG